MGGCSEVAPVREVTRPGHVAAEGATMVRRLLKLALLLLVATYPGALAAQTDPQLDVVGTWKGQCFGCAARAFTLKLAQNGSELTGTIQAEGTPNFGDDEKPLLNGKIAGRKVTFQARGNPGDLVDVEVTLSRDGKTMSGNGAYRGSFGLKFTHLAR